MNNIFRHSFRQGFGRITEAIMNLNSEIIICLMLCSLWGVIHCQQECRCDIAVFKRTACLRLPVSTISPNSDVTEQECVNSGCCFEETNRFSFFGKVPDCFQPEARSCPCEIPRGERESCLGAGSHIRFGCLRLGCCFDPTGGPADPPCYRRSLFREQTTSSPVTFGRRTASPTSAFQLSASWVSWSSWTQCNARCLRGVQTRTRRCFRGVQQVVDNECGQSGTSEERRECNSAICQNWNSWVEVGECSAPCGETGRIRITRSCAGSGNLGDEECYASFLACRTNCITEASAWSEWLEWSTCSESCGPGTRVRTRSCVVNGVSVSTTSCGGQNNSPSSVSQEGSSQVESCNMFMCSQWSSWSSDAFFCSPSCGPAGTIGRRIFYRTCGVDSSRALRTVQERNEFDECSRFPQFGVCILQPCPTPQTTTTESSFVTLPTLPRTFPPTLLPTTTTSTTTTTRRIIFRPSSTVLSTSPPTPRTFSTRQPSSVVTQPIIDVVWSTWTSCSATCGPGQSTRFPLCFRRNGVSFGDSVPCGPTITTQQRTCNSLFCENWGSWTNTGCVAECATVTFPPRGSTVRVRFCLTERREDAPSDCSINFSSCNPGFNACLTTTAPRTLQRTLPTIAPTTRSRTTTREPRIIDVATNPPTTSQARTLSTTSQTTPTTTEPTTSTTTSTTTTTTTTPITTTTSTPPPTTTSTTTRTSTMPPTTTSTTTTTTTTTTPTTTTEEPTTTEATTTTRQITWSTWGEWSACSESCGLGVRSRIRRCNLPGGCTGSDSEIEVCNVEFCNNWSSWAPSCSANCGGGQRIMRRVCEDQSQTVPSECSLQEGDGTCNTMPCDENLDILFLIDSSDYVDNCRQLRQDGFSIPITSEITNDINTPAHVRIRDFISQFAEDWRSISDNQTHVAIQQMSGACSSAIGRNFFLEKSFDESHGNFSATVDALPYRCGSFFLDFALTCAERRIFTAEGGDRSDVPNVMVILLSRPPAFAQPNEFLIDAISRRINGRGTTIISAGVTEESTISTQSQLTQYQELLSGLSCPDQASCPTYIGSIWDDDQGTPAERIRRALEDVNVL